MMEDLSDTSPCMLCARPVLESRVRVSLHFCPVYVWVCLGCVRRRLYRKIKGGGFRRFRVGDPEAGAHLYAFLPDLTIVRVGSFHRPHTTVVTAPCWLE